MGIIFSNKSSLSVLILIFLVFFSSSLSISISGDEFIATGVLKLQITNYSTNKTQQLASNLNVTIDGQNFDQDHSASQDRVIFMNFDLKIFQDYATFENRSAYNDLNPDPKIEIFGLQSQNISFASFLSIPIEDIIIGIPQEELDALHRDGVYFQYFEPILLPNGSRTFLFPSFSNSNNSIISLDQYFENGSFFKNYAYSSQLESVSSTVGLRRYSNDLLIFTFANSSNQFDDFWEIVFFNLSSFQFHSYLFPVEIGDHWYEIIEYDNALYVLSEQYPDYVFIDKIMSDGTRERLVKADYPPLRDSEQYIFYENKIILIYFSPFKPTSEINKFDKTLGTYNFTVYSLPALEVEQSYTVTTSYLQCYVDQWDDGYKTINQPSTRLLSFYQTESLMVRKTERYLFISNDYQIITYDSILKNFQTTENSGFYSCDKNYKISSLPINSTSEMVLMIDKLFPLQLPQTSNWDTYFPLLGITFLITIRIKRKKKN